MPRLAPLLLALLTACEEVPVPAFHVEVEAPQAGVVAGTPALLRLLLTDALDDVPLEGAALEVVPWMPAHGHGVPDDVVVSERAAGWYMAEVTFTMPGDWELQIHIEHGGHDGDVTVPLQVP